MVGLNRATGVNTVIWRGGVLLLVGDSSAILWVVLMLTWHILHFVSQVGWQSSCVGLISLHTRADSQLFEIMTNRILVSIHKNFPTERREHFVESHFCGFKGNKNICLFSVLYSMYLGVWLKTIKKKKRRKNPQSWQLVWCPIGLKISHSVSYQVCCGFL